MPVRRVLTDSPFDTLEKAFDALVTGPNPLAVDGNTLVGLPDRSVPLGELKAMLLHPSTSFPVRDRVVDELVVRSRNHGGAWTVGLAGVLLPGLRRATWPLTQACPARAAEIEAEALTALLAAVAACTPGRERLAARLCWLARIGAQRVLAAELSERARPGNDPVSEAPARPWGHPDLVLAKAVTAGVIAAADAELIGATRIGDVDLADAADSLGISYKTCLQRRRRAESALVKWLKSPDYFPGGFVEKAAIAPCSSSGGRPRHGR